MRSFSSKLWLISLLSVIMLPLSCSLDSADTGDMTLTLPTARTISESSYEITLTNSSGKDVVYTTVGGEYTIPKVKIGKYKISVFTTTSKNAYYGEETIVVRPGRNKAKLTLNLITLKKIDVKLKEDAYVPYGSAIDTTSFDITEYYEVPGYSKLLVNNQPNYSFYSVTPSSKTTEPGDISCTIKNMYNNVSKNSSIPCLFTLPTPTVTVDSKELNLVTGDRNTINASVNIESSIPSEYYTVKYNWLTKVNKTDDFYSIGDKADSPSFTIPTVSPADLYYACKVTLEVVEKYKKYSTNHSVEKLSDEIHVKVTQKNPNAPYITSIKAEPKKDAYVLFNESIKIDSFDITETYSDGNTKKVTDNSSYKLSNTNPITKIGDTSVTISNNNQNVNTSIPCKFKLPTATTSITPSGNTNNVQQGNSLSLTATVDIPTSTLPKDAYKVTNIWYKENIIIQKATELTYKVDTSIVGKASYKFAIKIEASNKYKDFCLDPPSTVYSTPTTITVIETSNPTDPETKPTPDPTPDQNYLTAQDLQKTIDNATAYGATITLNNNYLLDKTITIPQTKKIVATKPIIIKRKDGFTGSLLTSGSEGFSLGDTTSPLITLDGGNPQTAVEPLIRVTNSTTVTIKNCKFQNNYANSSYLNNQNNQQTHAGGGAIFSEGTVKIYNSTFDNNKSDFNGGALYIRDGSQNFLSDITFTNNTSLGNGGAIAIENTNPTVEIQNTFHINNNTAKNGGGIYMNGGKLQFNKTANGEIQNNNKESNGKGKNIFLEAKVQGSGPSFDGQAAVTNPTEKNDSFIKNK